MTIVSKTWQESGGTVAELAVAVRDLVGAEVDALVVGVWADGPTPRAATGLNALDKAFGGQLDQALEEVGATGALRETVRLPSLGALTARCVVGVGLGPVDGAAADVPAAVLREAAGCAVRALTGADSVGLALPAVTQEQVRAVALGGALGAYV